MTWHSVNPQERLMECRHPANVISHEGLLLLYANRRERPLVWQRTPWFYRGILICQLLFYLFFFSPHRKKGDLPKRTSLDLQAACSYLFVTDCCSQRPPKFLNNKGCLSNPANVWAHAQCLLMIMQLFCNKEFQQYHVRRESLIISATRN